MIEKHGIASLIPHQGAMCLLDRIVAWDAVSIRCLASSHRDPDNPLRVSGALPAACGIEYAAQAMAAHGALVGATGGAPHGGYLASLRDVALAVRRLDDLVDDLEITAERQAGTGSQVAYRFGVTAGGRELLGGRALVLLEGGAA